jgi:GC-rich sequence DNA-binding factor
VLPNSFRLASFSEQILSDGEEVFDDVIDEFRDLDLILKHFEEWKRFDLDSYKEAYVNLSLPKIVSPLVRLSIITWNPFEVNIPIFRRVITTYYVSFIGI